MFTNLFSVGFAWPFEQPAVPDGQGQQGGDTCNLRQTLRVIYESQDFLYTYQQQLFHLLNMHEQQSLQ